MNPEKWADEFERQTGVSLDAVLRPISAPGPSGVSLVGEPVYREIKVAREQDDPSVPQGVWACELKRADWVRVQKLTLEAIQTRSKDLQLGVWLLEALFEQRGFAGLAPGVHLLARLSERYWDVMHPARDTDDGERRANVLYAAVRRLVPRLRLVPVCGGDDDAFTWADWMRARRNQQLTASGVEGAELEGPTLAACQKALRATPSTTLAGHLIGTRNALASLAHFRSTLEPLRAEHPLTWGEVPALLVELERFFSVELEARQYHVDAELSPASTNDNLGASTLVELDERLAERSAREPPVPRAAQDLVLTRAQAYYQLGEIAQLLSTVDPHSPTPYLLQRAIAWGQLSTSQLYDELFIKGRGQLSIFELMGIETKADG